MANRYWVGGTGNWGDDDNHWATSSGGSPGDGNLPTSSDDVFIDSNSGFGGGGTITVTEESLAECASFSSSSGHTSTITCDPGISLEIYGSFIGENGMTVDIPISFCSTEGGNTITSNGTEFRGEVEFFGGGEWELQDNFVGMDDVWIGDGTFDANDNNITVPNVTITADESNVPTVIMGSGTWDVQGGGWTIEESGGEVVTIVPETSTIKIGGGGDGVTGGGKTYNNIWIVGPTSVFGSNTFNGFRINDQCDTIFEDEQITTVSSFIAKGTKEGGITLNSISGSSQFTLSKTSGIVVCDYLDLNNSNATGGATWYAGSHSADTDNNDGWIFEGWNSPLPSYFKPLVD